MFDVIVAQMVLVYHTSNNEFYATLNYRQRSEMEFESFFSSNLLTFFYCLTIQARNALDLLLST